MPKLHAAIIPKNIFRASPHLRPHAPVSTPLAQAAAMDVTALYEQFASHPEGLSTEQAGVRREKCGPNVLAKDIRPSIAALLLHAVLNPIMVLLAILSGVSVVTGDYRAASMMLFMIIIGVGLKLFQESKADHAAAKLKAMISIKATILRDGKPQEVSVSQLVPGDIVVLAAGDMIPADVRLSPLLCLHASHLRTSNELSRHYSLANTPSALWVMALMMRQLSVPPTSGSAWTLQLTLPKSRPT